MLDSLASIQLSKPLFHLGDEDDPLDRVISRVISRVVGRGVGRGVGRQASHSFEDSLFGRCLCRQVAETSPEVAVRLIDAPRSPQV